MKRFYFTLVLALIGSSLIGQGTAYTLKAGATVGLQTWDRLDANPLLFQPGLAIEIESLSADEGSALYAQLGYFTRGSRTRIRSYINTDGDIVNTSGNFKFNNASLQLGARAIKPSTESRTVYYGIAGRLEYNVSNNLDQYAEVGSNIYTTLPVPEFVNSITYGLSLSGGIRWYLSDRYDGIVEIQVNSDLNNQYAQPPLANVRDPRTGNPVTLPARTVRNTSIELLFGIRLIK